MLAKSAEILQYPCSSALFSFIIWFTGNVNRSVVFLFNATTNSVIEWPLLSARRHGKGQSDCVLIICLKLAWVVFKQDFSVDRKNEEDIEISEGDLSEI